MKLAESAAAVRQPPLKFHVLVPPADWTEGARIVPPASRFTVPLAVAALPTIRLPEQFSAPDQLTVSVPAPWSPTIKLAAALFWLNVPPLMFNWPTPLVKRPTEVFWAAVAVPPD